MSIQTPEGPTRRQFLNTSAALLAAGALGAPSDAAESRAERRQPAPGAAEAPPARPIVVGSANNMNDSGPNGRRAIDVAMAMLREGRDPLDAVVACVNQVEDDPNDDSVGYGGLPNEDGVVELDASVMHGPAHRAGAVASLRNIRNPSSVARLVLQRTDHVLLVGEGALRFARAHGFKEEDLLTDASRRKWLRWKEAHSDDDDWLTPEQGGFAPSSQPAADPRPLPATQQSDAGAREVDVEAGLGRARRARLPLTWGTINCLAVTRSGDMAGVTSTSGLSWKIPGRVGDSPIIGAGLYVDNAIGAAGSTGRGEANLQNCSSFLIVELMRPRAAGGAGLAPVDACLEVMKRIADHTEPRLRDKQGRPDFGLLLYAVDKSGRHGVASMWGPAPGGKRPQYALHDGTAARLADCACLFRR